MRGFTLVELLIVLAITLVISAGLAWVADEVQGHMVVQPEISDLVQRGRVAAGGLERELSLAGAGLYRGEVAGSLVHWIPAIHPDRRWDAVSGAAVSADDLSVTVLRVPDDAAQGGVAGEMGGPGDAVRVRPEVCPLADDACGFREGQRAVIFDALGGFDLFTVTAAGAGTIWHQPVLFGRGYRESDRAVVSEVLATTYYYDPERRQIRRSVGERVDAPVVDQVVGLSLSYYGDPFPPDRPRPPPGRGNCLFDESGHRRLAELMPTDGMLVRLTMAQLRDGPFCGEGVQRFDADLYRLRRVRVSVRIQVAVESLRGRDPLLFRLPGTASRASRQVPDLEVRFEVAPRNLQVR